MKSRVLALEEDINRAIQITRQSVGKNCQWDISQQMNDFNFVPMFEQNWENYVGYVRKLKPEKKNRI